jgi:hydroxymethylpyrimidine/phosphomethylpyrimidine kinase
MEPAKVLTIAGSDSGGAAGLQADIKTFTSLNVYGMSVVTAVTAQNSVSVTAVHPLPPDFVAAQLDAVLSDCPCQMHHNPPRTKSQSLVAARQVLL